METVTYGGSGYDWRLLWVKTFNIGGILWSIATFCPGWSLVKTWRPELQFQNHVHFLATPFCCHCLCWLNSLKFGGYSHPGTYCLWSVFFKAIYIYDISKVDFKANKNMCLNLPVLKILGKLCTGSPSLSNISSVLVGPSNHRHGIVGSRHNQPWQKIQNIQQQECIQPNRVGIGVVFFFFTFHIFFVHWRPDISPEDDQNLMLFLDSLILLVLVAH